MADNMGARANREIDRQALEVVLRLIRAVVKGEARRGERYEYQSPSGNGGQITSRRGDLCVMRDAVLRTINDLAAKAGIDLTRGPGPGR